MKLIKLFGKVFRKKKLKIRDISTGKDISKHIELEIFVDKRKGRDKNFTLVRDDFEGLERYSSELHYGGNAIEFELTDSEFDDFTNKNENKGSE